MQKRFVYILLSSECEVLATETSLKKIIDKYAEAYKLPNYRYLQKKLAPLKEKGEQLKFKADDGQFYRLSASRVQ